MRTQIERTDRLIDRVVYRLLKGADGGGDRSGGWRLFLFPGYREWSVSR